MRILHGILALGITLALGSSAWAQPPNAPFSIKLSTVKPEVKAGSDIYLRIQMTNTSNHDVDCTRVASNGSDRAYTYDVFDANGNPLEKRTRKHPEIGETFSSWPCVLKPGESTSEDDSLLSSLYDMTRPGKYSVQVSRYISGDRKENGVTKSNMITITVNP